MPLSNARCVPTNPQGARRVKRLIFLETVALGERVLAEGLAG